MKKLLVFISILAMLAFWACSDSGTNPDEDLPQVASILQPDQILPLSVGNKWWYRVTVDIGDNKTKSKIIKAEIIDYEDEKYIFSEVEETYFSHLFLYSGNPIMGDFRNWLELSKDTIWNGSLKLQYYPKNGVEQGRLQYLKDSSHGIERDFFSKWEKIGEKQYKVLPVSVINGVNSEGVEVYYFEKGIGITNLKYLNESMETPIVKIDGIEGKISEFELIGYELK